MTSILARRTHLRGAFLAFTLGALGILPQLGCGGGGGSSAAPSTPPTFAPAQSPLITAPAYVTSGQGGYTASTPAQAGATLTWSITNGTFSSATNSTSVTFTAGTSGAVGLTCTATSGGGTAAAPGTASSTIVAAPTTPVVTAPANVTAGQAGYTASIPAQAGCTYAWTLTGGAITAGATTTSITFTPGASGAVGISCVVTNAAGTASTAGTASSTIAVAPTTPVITAPGLVTASRAGYTASIPAQAGSTYAWTLTGGTLTAGATTTSITFTPGASGTVGLSCVVTNGVGIASSAGTASSTIVAAPTTPVVTAPANVTAGQAGYTASIPAQAGCTYAWTLTGGTITAGATTTSITFTPGASGTVSFSCIVTNAAGTAANAGTASSTIFAAPATPVITAPAFVTASQAGYTASIPAQPGSTYAWTLTGGTLTAGATTTSITFIPGASGTVGFSCIVTNGAGTASTAGLASSTIVAPPTTPVVTAPANVTAGQAGFTASIPAQAGSTYAWTLTGGTITAGATTTSITFTPGASGTVGFSCIVTNAGNTASTAGTASSTIVAAPATPTITAPANVTAGQAGYTASIPAQAGSTYAWTLTGGNLTAGATTTSITFTPGASGTVGLSCIVTNAANTASTAGTASSTVVAAPAIPTITAPANVTASQAGYTASIPAQAAGSTYAWVLTGGSITAGASSTTVTFTPGASGTVGFSCVVTNAATTPSTAGTASSTIVAAPATPSITAPANVTAGQAGYTASILAQPGSTYAWTLTGGNLTAGATTTSITFTPGASGTVGLSCIVTNAANTPSTAGTASSTIVPIPSISQLAASPADVAPGGTATLSYSFTGGTGVITPGNIAVTSGGSNGVTVASTTTYTLTVTNPANTTTTDTVTVTVGAAAAISSFTALPATITAGQGTLLTFNFTGDGTIDHGVGAVTTGHQVAVFPTVNTTYTLTVTSSLGGTPVTATVPITVKTYVGKFVYVANSGGGVSAFSLNDDTGVLTEVANSPFDDTHTALHVTSDPGGKFLFVVNGDGLTSGPHTLTVFKIDSTTGALTTVGAYAAGTDPWASTVDPSGKFVYVRSEGAIRSFSLNGTSGVLTPLATTTTSGGTGEVLVPPSGTHLYTVGRSSDSLQVFNLNPANGLLTANSTMGLPAGAGPLALALSHSGEYLFTKSEGAPGGAAQACVVYGYFVDAQTGGLFPIADTSTGLDQADAFHGVSANPTLPVIYITLATSDNDFAAYAFNLQTGELSALGGTTYSLFGGTGSDSLAVSRNGKWGFLTNFNGDQIAIGTVDPVTGILSNPTFKTVGISPVSVTVVGVVQ